MYGLAQYRPVNHELEYNPFKTMADFEKRFFGEPFVGFMRNTEPLAFKTDISDQGDKYLLEADLPGFKKEDVNLDLDGDKLTIKAERHSEHEEKDDKGNLICSERSFGSYSRSFDVSEVNTEEITAKLEDGVLTLDLPKKQASVPTARRIEVQ